MATTKSRLALSFLTTALVAAPAYAGSDLHERNSAATGKLMAIRTEMGLDQSNAFVLRTAMEDERGETHARFQQTFNGVKVFGGEVITHTAKDGAFLPPTKDYRTNIYLSTQASLSPSEALAAVHDVLAPKGAYSSQPTAELVVFPEMVEVVRKGARLEKFNAEELNAEDMIREALRYTLAYHVHVELENDLDGIQHLDYIVNAHTGAILKTWNDLHTAGANGTGKSQHSGTVSLATNSKATGFELRDMIRGTGGTFGNNVTTNMNGSTTGNGAVYADADNTWGDGLNYLSANGSNSANGQTAGVDAMFGMMKSWDYFLNVHARNGINGAGKATYSRVHYSNAYDNAFWSDSCFCMTYGDGSSLNVLTALDVAGHEMSHGVMAATAALVYSGESGGLNESNSDIFGAMIEFHARGGSGSVIGNTGGNWLIGEQVFKDGTFLRHMVKPSKDGVSPDAWSSTLGSLDVHYSSGPNNRMFYFLSQGAGTTAGADNHSSFLPGGMAGIGNDKAARIWYRTLAAYLTSSSNYAAARAGAINAAKDLYGAGGVEEQAVWNAYAAINVGAKWGSATGDTTAPTVSASESGTSGTITFNAAASDNVGVTKVVFYVDGLLKGTDTTSPYSMTLDSATLTNASHSLTAKAYDAAGNVATSTAVAFSVNNAAGAEKVVNGDFENGITGWSGWTRFIGAWFSQPAFSGTRCAWLGGTDFTATKYIYQKLSIPSAATSATLSFYLHVDTEELPNGAYDTFYVQVRNSAGSVLKTLATYTNLNANTGYAKKSFDLSAYKGQTVQIYFKSVSDSTYDTNFVIDKVSLQAP